VISSAVRWKYDASTAAGARWSQLFENDFLILFESTKKIKKTRKK
jgi:hypothetical protein